jgi:hypothetical protein
MLCIECLEVALEGKDEHCVHCHAVAKPVIAAPVPVAASVGPRAGLPAATVVGSGAAVVDADASPVTKILSYLFARETLLTLVALTIFTTILRALSVRSLGIAGMGLALVATGLDISYYFRVLTSMTHGEPHFETPDFSSLGEDVFDPLIRYIATLVPLIVAVFWLGQLTTGHWLHGLVVLAVRPHSIFDYSGPGLLFGAWLALWPLMTMIAAIGKSIISAYNPVIWAKTLAMLNTRYVVGAVAFYALVLAEAYAIPQLAGLLTIPYVGVLAIAFVANLAMALRACVLGMVCQPYS